MRTDLYNQSGTHLRLTTNQDQYRSNKTNETSRNLVPLELGLTVCKLNLDLLLKHRLNLEFPVYVFPVARTSGDTCRV